MTVSECLVSPVSIPNEELDDHDRAVKNGIENSTLESLRTSLKEEITWEIKGLSLESQRELLKLLKSKTGENVNNECNETIEEDSKSFYTPTRFGKKKPYFKQRPMYKS